MKYKLVLITALIYTIGACTVSKKVTKNSAVLKQEARDFSLSIIQSYFTKDCNKVYASMNDSLLIMDGDGVFLKIDIKKKLCRSLKKAIRDKNKTFKDYLESYIVEILSQKDLEKKFNITLPTYFKKEDTNFFFIGSKLKKGKEETNHFIWDDLFVFMVNKKNKIWTLKGLSG